MYNCMMLAASYFNFVFFILSFIHSSISIAGCGKELKMKIWRFHLGMGLLDELISYTAHHKALLVCEN